MTQIRMKTGHMMKVVFRSPLYASMHKGSTEIVSHIPAQSLVMYLGKNYEGYYRVLGPDGTVGWLGASCFNENI